MAINFPDSPNNGDQHTASGITWTWDGTTWKADGITSSYTLPTASSTVLGGVKVGTNLSINGSGVLSASGGEITVQEEGSALATAATTLNFVGSNVTATGTGATKTITITDSGNTQLTTEEVQDIVGAMFSGNTETNITATYEDSDGTIDLVASGGGGQPEITWTLGAPNSSHYTFTGSGFTGAVNDPTLYLIRGQTYKFDNQTGGHPFRIQSTVAQVGGGVQYNSGVTNNDAGNGTTLTFVVPMDAPDTLYYQCTAHPAMFGTINILNQQPNLDSRSTFTNTTASLANNAAGNISVTAHKSYMLLKIKPSIAAWVTLYVDDASRTADASRVQGVDPAPDAGVIAEVVTTSANQEIKMSPGVLGWHQDGGNDAVDTVFCKVVNKSGSTGTCTVSLTVVQLEA